MNPVLITLPIQSGFPIHSFIFMLVLALVVALALAVAAIKRIGLPKNAALDIGLLAAFAGILGARLFFVLFENNPVGKARHPFLDFGEGELSAWGGIFAAAATAFAYSKIKNIPFAKILDLYAFPTAVGFFIGRIGCLLAGCCWGKVTPPNLASAGMLFPEETDVMTKQWIDFVDHPAKWESLMHTLGYPADQSPSLPVYPTQLIFIAAMLVLSAILAWKGFGKKASAETTEAAPQQKTDGNLFLVFCAFFAAVHFLVGFIRDDIPPLFKSGAFFNIQLGQVVALIVFVAATALLRSRKSA